ncbi:hypothetical protein L861_10250 [Litchfieldella anticariensis FP35 = DSM 16096]|uniref:GST N-terminal domain-containing protein n=1 Tax=Litchfieldella anticariensis (strain DSM 16096 / CECT 5854 / CIP 108499 / LMG 22089 / FP35) TaxID=1121939 RepID=S2KKN5_LITA3|nr:glutathione S-transferase [Halomonas anticariensis]EPC02717.1 hypothetical protein L861_10250 [Halomonas anticariensis FP35 = DSM 16096]
MSLELFLNATSPYARVARICAQEKGFGDRLTLRWVDPWADDEALLEANPHAKVPTLRTPEGVTITETLLIASYLDNIGTGPDLLPAEALAEVLHGVGLGMGLIDAAFQQTTARRHADLDDPDRSVLGRRRLAAIERTLTTLEAETAPRHRYADDAHLTLDDIVIGVGLDYLRLRFQELDWVSHYPALAAWEDARLSRRSFQYSAFT